MYRRRCASPSVRHRGTESPCSHHRTRVSRFLYRKAAGGSGCWSDVCPLSSVVERASSILVTKHSRSCLRGGQWSPPVRWTSRKRFPRHIIKASHHCSQPRRVPWAPIIFETIASHRLLIPSSVCVPWPHVRTQRFLQGRGNVCSSVSLRGLSVEFVGPVRDVRLAVLRSKH